jgi:hypothetical protein
MCYKFGYCICSGILGTEAILIPQKTMFIFAEFIYWILCNHKIIENDVGQIYHLLEKITHH